MTFIEKKPIIPFESAEGGTFYCKRCMKYSTNFTPSAIARRYRYCRSCQKCRKSSSHPKNRTHVQNLKRLLYKTLYSKGQGGFARALDDSTIECILKLRKVRASDVKRILLPEDLAHVSDLSKYGLVVYGSTEEM